MTASGGVQSRHDYEIVLADGERQAMESVRIEVEGGALVVFGVVGGYEALVCGWGQGAWRSFHRVSVRW